ncbi:SdiA-regulated domain-containing protein [Nonlabens antarcticus]|uniref:SdiA-regulated domain-containing protein n=1 Tax=Nonlabens antarcticus TaxID=392714 RepID=UPI0018914524|nr:SdiA-regulated domain-containing protein [Nonlabens antarcticus]
MKSFKYIIVGVIIAAAIAIVLAFTLNTSDVNSKKSDDYIIKNTWELPKVLSEISGITWLSDNKIASVQDEDGVIFIYDLEKKEVVEEIKFAGSGDYEGIAVYKIDAYVLRSDGKIFKVARFRESEKVTTTSFDTGFTEKNNMESLTLDTTSSFLIVAPKDRDSSDDFKGLYQVKIDSEKREAKPAVKINMNDAALKEFKNKKAYKTFSPSDVAIHPVTKEYYVLEGKNPKLVILNRDGAIKNVIKLDKDDFAQPEGITFSPDGTLYISNEAGKGKATIVQVDLSL